MKESWNHGSKESWNQEIKESRNEGMKESRNQAINELRKQAFKESKNHGTVVDMHCSDTFVRVCYWDTNKQNSILYASGDFFNGTKKSRHWFATLNSKLPSAHTSF